VLKLFYQRLVALQHPAASLRHNSKDRLIEPVDKHFDQSADRRL
jgi:hypothetical protein